MAKLHVASLMFSEAYHKVDSPSHGSNGAKTEAYHGTGRFSEPHHTS